MLNALHLWVNFRVFLWRTVEHQVRVLDWGMQEEATQRNAQATTSTHIFKNADSENYISE